MESAAVLVRYKNDVLPSMSDTEVVKELEDVTRLDQQGEHGSHSDALKIVRNEILRRLA